MQLNFNYKGKSPLDQPVSGTIAAESRGDAVKALKARGIKLTALQLTNGLIKPKAEAAPPSRPPGWLRKAREAAAVLSTPGVTAPAAAVPVEVVAPVASPARPLSARQRAAAALTAQCEANFPHVCKGGLIATAAPVAKAAQVESAKRQGRAKASNAVTRDMEASYPHTRKAGHGRVDLKSPLHGLPRAAAAIKAQCETSFPWAARAS